MKKEDFEKIKNIVKKYETDKDGKVFLKEDPTVKLDDQLLRSVKMGHLLHMICTQKLFTDADRTEKYTQTMYEQMLPFFNDFEQLIKDSTKNINGIYANDIEALLEKHDNDCKHFYSIVEQIFIYKNAMKTFVEHALDTNVESASVDFSSPTRKNMFVGCDIKIER